jgi:hypothetical protein
MNEGAFMIEPTNFEKIPPVERRPRRIGAAGAKLSSGAKCSSVGRGRRIVSLYRRDPQTL